MAYLGEISVRATTRYQKKAYDEIKLRVRKGQKEIIAEYCKSHGKTVNGLINELLAREVPGLKGGTIGETLERNDSV